MSVQYGHARNSHPAPPITIRVEQGVVTSFTIEKRAIRKYSNEELAILFEAAGVGLGRLSMPIPERFMNVPLSDLRIRMLPGEYAVTHTGDRIELPESAFEYSVEKSNR